MKNLASPKVIKEILDRTGFKFSKSLGQNFLIDENVLTKITDASDLDGAGVIEIGPGFGTLTQRLAKCAEKVVAIEIDKTAIPVLEDNLSDFSNVKIINEDVLKCDLHSVIKEEFGGMNVKVCANLPYYITTPIIMHILEEKLNVESLTVMIQKEVAMRIGAKAGTKDYGALTLAVNYYAQSEIITHVPPSAFIPQPKVSSTVIKLTMRKEPPVRVNDEKGFFKVVKASFGQRRKTLLNALSNSSFIPLSKEDVKKALENAGIDEKRRGETLTIEEFANLSNEIFK